MGTGLASKQITHTPSAIMPPPMMSASSRGESGGKTCCHTKVRLTSVARAKHGVLNEYDVVTLSGTALDRVAFCAALESCKIAIPFGTALHTHAVALLCISDGQAPVTAVRPAVLARRRYKWPIVAL